MLGAMAALYRRYRPQTFGELVGQDHVRETLLQAVRQDKLTHAYLFHGPRGTGKTTCARLLAKRVNCLQPDGVEPCLKCESCTALHEGRHLDVIEIDAASNRGIDDIRALREAASFRPVLGAYKVYIIDEVHMLTNEAASALLKTLEEPVAHVLFILATTELHKVLPTIASRCQVFRFRRAYAAELRDRLTFILKGEQREAEDTALEFIIDRADGCFRDAESLLGQLLTIQNGRLTAAALTSFLGLPARKELDNFLQALAGGNAQQALAAVDAMFGSGIDAEQLLREGIREARDEAVRAAQGSQLRWAGEAAAALSRLPHVIRALLQALQDLAYVPQPMIALHLAILTVCMPKGAATHAAEPQLRTSVRTAVAQPAKASAPVRARSSHTAAERKGEISIERVQEVWPALVERVKPTNPVAATFLRAVAPERITNGMLTVTVQYPLHRTFFERTENRKLLADTLEALLGRPLTVTVVLDENGSPARRPLAEMRRQHEEQFQQTVQEMFGTAKV